MAVTNWFLLRAESGRGHRADDAPLSSIGASASAAYRAGVLQTMGVEEADLALLVSEAAAADLAKKLARRRRTEADAAQQADSDVSD